MQELEKILEEIDERINYYRDNAIMEYVDVCAGLRETQKIIRKHMNDGWISVEDRLPEEDKDVLITYADIDTGEPFIGITHHGYKYIAGCRFDSKEWQSPFAYFRENYVVTAWQPLPSPYQQERSKQ